MRLKAVKFHVASAIANRIVCEVNKKIDSALLLPPIPFYFPDSQTELNQAIMSQPALLSSVSNQLPKRLIDKFAGNPLKRLKGSENFLAKNDLMLLMLSKKN